MEATSLRPVLLGCKRKNAKPWGERSLYIYIKCIDFKLYKKVTHANGKPKGRAQSVMWGSREGAGGLEILPRTQIRSQKTLEGIKEQGWEQEGFWGCYRGLYADLCHTVNKASVKNPLAKSKVLLAFSQLVPEDQAVDRHRQERGDFRE